MDTEDDEEAETGASVNGDVEDNLEETGKLRPAEVVGQEIVNADIYCPGRSPSRRPYLTADISSSFSVSYFILSSNCLGSLADHLMASQ